MQSFLCFENFDWCDSCIYRGFIIIKIWEPIKIIKFIKFLVNMCHGHTIEKLLLKIEASLTKLIFTSSIESPCSVHNIWASLHVRRQWFVAFMGDVDISYLYICVFVCQNKWVHMPDLNLVIKAGIHKWIIEGWKERTRSYS